MPPPDPPLHPKGLSIPMTQTLTPVRPPLTLPQLIQPHPPPPDTPADPDLDNTEPCEGSPLMTPPLSTSWVPI